VNVWTFTGNLGRDASTRYTSSGNAVTEISVAVTSGYGDNKKTSWVRCNYWGKRGEAVAPYLLKGTQVCISGEAHLHEYEKRDKSGTGYSLELRVSELTLIGGKDKKPAQTTSQEPQQGFRDRPADTGGPDGVGEDDIPF
jgi:single-strand DNA-binding protein